MSEQRWAGAFEPYGKGKKAAVGALLDADLRERLERYKRQVAKRYRVVEPDILDGVLPKEDLWIAPKLDGELWFLVKAGGDVALVAYNGRVLLGVSALDGVRERLASAPDLVIPGELVATAPGSERARSHHTGTALSEPRLEPTLSFFAFDLAEDAGADALAWPFEKRWARLVELLGEGDAAPPRCRLVPMHRGDPAAVARLYREWVATTERYEGVVVRSERGLTYKIKPTRTIDLVVVAFGERLTGDARQVRELQVGLLREDGTFQLVGSVGTGLSDDDRARWHARLSALESRSTFRLANREGTLCRFVRPEIVVEVRVSDMLSSDAWDVPIRRMALAYDASEGWRAVTEMRTAVPLHPVFLRERTDKKVDAGSVGMTQIAPWLEDAPVEALRASTTRVSAEIVRRGVFTKETKGQLAVRKFVVIRTHKEHEGSHPPFVVYFTDFSQGRKAPLETNLRTAADQAGADAHVALWLEENVKRGWSEVEAQRRGAPPALPAPAPPPQEPATATEVADAPRSASAAATPSPAPKKRSPRKSPATSE